MSIPKFAVSRPVTILMLIIGSIVLGAVSVVRLPLTMLPEMNFPAAAVMVEYPNVGPWEVEAQVTRPIEEVMATVSNVTRVTSVTETGQATIVAEFSWGTDMNFATLEMRERLDLIHGYLPDDISRPQVFKFDPSMTPMFQFNIGGGTDQTEVRRFAEQTIKPRIERIDGVASVEIGGGFEREIRVELDPLRMEQYNVAVDMVQQVLYASNLNYPVGSVTDTGRTFLVRTVGEYKSLDEIRNTIVNVSPAGTVRLSEIADVLDTHKPQTTLTRLNGAPSVTVTVQKESEANVVQVSNLIQDELKTLRAEFGDSVELQVVWDDAAIIRSSVNTVIENGFVGAIAATLVLLLFLGAFAPTLIIALAIPVAVVSTLFFLFIFDVSLNMLSLGGLALGIGMLVDNAIVSLENITRHRQLGANATDASVLGAKEVVGALFASTLTTVAVFLPVVFVGGMAAQIFSDLSLAVTFSLVMSLAVAVTFVPMLAARMNIEPKADSKLLRLIDQLSDWYGNVLTQAVKRRYAVFGILAALIVATVVLYPFIGREFLPAMDTGEFDVRLELPHGTPTKVTERLAAEIEEYLFTIPEVETVSASIADEQADFYIGMIEGRSKRRPVETVVEQVRAYGDTIPGAKLRVTSSDPFGVEGGLSAPISLIVKGPDPDRLAAVSEDIAALVREVPGTREVGTSLSEGRPELQIILDRDEAARYGLTVAQVASAIRVGVDGAVVTRYRTGDADGTELDVRVQLAPEWREKREHMERLRVSTPLGVNVRLGDIATIVEGRSPVRINREGGSRVVRVFSHTQDRDLSSVQADIDKKLALYPLPSDMTVEPGGDIAEMEDAFDRLGFALVLAVLLIYMILAAQFESLVQPFIIMLSVPMALIGVVIGLLVTGQALSVPAMIGIIMLAGIVVNNAIVLIDFINQYVERGMSRHEAIIEGCKARLRPVLMTTLTTVLGMVPLALGIGDGSELMRPISVVVIGGLSFSTLLTLLLIPVLYDAFSDWGNKLSESRQKRKEAREQGKQPTVQA